MATMLQSAVLLPSNPFVSKPTFPALYQASFCRRTLISAVSLSGAPNSTPAIPKASGFDGILLKQQFSSIAPPTTQFGRNLGLRPSPELGLLSLLFVLTTAIGAFFSLAVISLPTLHAFRRLAISADKLSKIVSEEVPGTLSSFKLSGLEINDLTQQLSNLRQRISGNQSGRNGSMPKTNRGRNNPIVY